MLLKVVLSLSKQMKSLSVTIKVEATEEIVQVQVKFQALMVMQMKFFFNTLQNDFDNFPCFSWTCLEQYY